MAQLPKINEVWCDPDDLIGQIGVVIGVDEKFVSIHFFGFEKPVELPIHVFVKHWANVTMMVDRYRRLREAAKAAVIAHGSDGECQAIQSLGKMLAETA